MGLQKETGTSKHRRFQINFKVRIKYQVEKYISPKNNKLETFCEKWPKDTSPL